MIKLILFGYVIMSEYINIIWDLIELSASVLECVLIVNFLIRMLGYKKPEYRFFKVLGFLAISLLNCTYTPMIINIGTASAIMQIVICIGFSILFLRGHIGYKIFVSMLSIMMITIINAFIVMLAGSIMNFSAAEIISASGGVRFMLLFLTKLFYFILSYVIIKFSENVVAKMTRKESILVIVILVGVALVGCAVFEIITLNIVKNNTVILAGAISLGTAIPFIVIYFMKNKKNSGYRMKEFRVSKFEHYINKKYSKNNVETLKDVIIHAITECVNQDIMLNCNVTPDVENVSESDVIIIISEMLYETVHVHKKYVHKPYIDFEILNKDGELSIIVSHYLVNPKSEIKSDEFILFNPYKNIIINNLLCKYNGEVFQHRSADKIITNMWMDFSEIINKVAC